MKRGVWFVIFLLLVSAVSAVPPTVTLSPQEFYETNDIDFELNISNFRGDYEITSIQLNLNPVTIGQQVDYKGWIESSYDTIATWSSGSIATNTFLEIFELLAKAPLVEDDLSSNATLTLTDDEDDEHTFTFPISILNDNTPPEISDFLPEDGSFVREGTDNQPVQLSAQDPETGIANATFNYIRCNFEENITPEQQTVSLEGQDNLTIYSNIADFSQYENEHEVCFDFSVYNNGGEVSTYEGTLTIDGLPPTVILIAPEDGLLVGMHTEFTFQASDNLAPVMTCSLVIDGEATLENISAPDMDTVQIPSAEVEEGEHTWSISCRDQVDLEGNSDTWTYTLDKTPPNITMTAPENGSVVADSALLGFSVSDNYQLERVWYRHDGVEYNASESFDIVISEWSDGPNEVTVYAEDFVGNLAVKTYNVIIDREAPVLTLVSPENNSTSDVHVNFTFVADDLYDAELDCDLYIDGSNSSTMVAIDGEQSVFAELLAVGEYQWSVQCIDDAGNIGVGSDWLVEVIDLTGPDITMNNPDVVYRGDPIEIEFTVDDISGVDAVEAQMRDPDDDVQTISLTSDEDLYTASVQTTANSTLGNYVLEVLAYDTLNNSNAGIDDVLVTYRYIISMDLSPSTANPSQSVVVSGLVLYDNGTLVPETHAVLSVPLNNGSDDVNITLTDGTFSHTFAAPSLTGDYQVGMQVDSEENGLTYTDSETLAVRNPQQGGGNGGNGGGGGSGSGNLYIDDDDTSGCSTEWRCTAWTTCSDEKQKRTCIDHSHCSDDSSRTETRSCTMPEEEEENEYTTTETASVAKGREPLPEPEEYEIDAVQENTGDPAGIGEASGFLGMGPAALAKTLFVMLLMAMLLALLYKHGYGAIRRRRKTALHDVLSGRDKLGLEDYLEKRNK